MAKNFKIINLTSIFTANRPIARRTLANFVFETATVAFQKGIPNMTLGSTILSLLVSALLVGCSSASSSSPSPTPSSSPSASSLSTAYTSKCAGCHGKDGATKQGGSALKGSTTAQAAWESAIRSGVGTMPSFKTSDYSDTYMKSDYKVLTGSTWK